MLRGSTLRLQLRDEIVVVTSLPRAVVIVNTVIEGLFAMGFLPSIGETSNLVGYLNGDPLLIVLLLAIPAVIAFGIPPSFGWTNCIVFAGQTGRREGSNKLLETRWRGVTETVDAEDIMQFRVGRAKGMASAVWVGGGDAAGGAHRFYGARSWSRERHGVCGAVSQREAG